MNLVVINDRDNMRARIAPDAWLITNKTNAEKLRGLNFDRTYLIGFTAATLKETNSELYEAIRLTMASSNDGVFIS